MPDLPKSLCNRDGTMYLPLSWKDAYHLRYILRQRAKHYPEEHRTRRILRSMEPGTSRT